MPSDIIDLVDLELADDMVGQLWGHPHFRHGCDLVLQVSHCGVVYCADCASSIGSIDPRYSGLQLGRGGRAARWLSHEAIMQAWKEGDKHGKD